MSRTDLTQRLQGYRAVAPPDDCGPWAGSIHVPEEGCESGSPPPCVASPNARARDAQPAGPTAPLFGSAQNAFSVVAPLRQWLRHPGSHSGSSAPRALRIAPASIALHDLARAAPATESELHYRLPCQSTAPANSL